MAEAPPAATDVVTDQILGGRLTLRQRRRGHRAGTDAILLAAAVPAVKGLLVDAGAGVGTAGLAAGLRLPGLDLLLIDNDACAIHLAGENLEANGLGGRGSAIVADLLDAKSRRAAGVANSSADILITNPPFLSPERHRSSADPQKAHAHIAAGFAGEAEFLDAWVQACAALLRDGGLMIMIHRAESLATALRAFETRLGGIAILPVHAHADRPAIRVLIAARKGSRAPLSLSSGLVLHEPGGGFTPLVESIHRGEASLDWLHP